MEFLTVSTLNFVLFGVFPQEESGQQLFSSNASGGRLTIVAYCTTVVKRTIWCTNFDLQIALM
jgi:hypothetical protein